MTGPWTFGWTQLLTIVGFLITGSIAVTGFRTFERAYHALGVHCRSSGRAHPIIRQSTASPTRRATARRWRACRASP